MKTLLLTLALIAGLFLSFGSERAQTDQGSVTPSIAQVKHLKDFQVVEFRRYTIKEGERAHFAQYFESYFPEAFEQLGSIAVGTFFERKDPSHFTWIRAFHNMDDRAKINAEFYYGPLWREHAATMNSLMTDSNNVLLLKSLEPERSIAVYPAVDPVTEPQGAQGVVVAEIFTIQANGLDEFVRQADPVFASYREAGAREAAVLVSFEGANNFPQLPVRTDGPHMLWLGVLRNDDDLDKRLKPLVEHSVNKLSATGLLRGVPEFVVLDPTHRSRLRWLSEEGK